MIRFLLLPLLLLGFAASAQTAPTTAPRLGLNRPASTANFTAGLNATPTPLYIIDGYLLEAAHLSDINPNQIESINVVKGSEAIALYGEKGRGGVIMITTKPPKTGR